MKYKKIISTVLIFLLAYSSTFAGGGWPKEKNTYYLKLASFLLSADENFNKFGDRNDLLTQGLFNISVYGEYGITDRLTAVAHIPFLARTFENELFENGVQNPSFPGRDQNTFGDIELGLKYGLLKAGKFSWTAGITLGIPTGNSDGGVNEPLATGDGEFNQIIRTDLGISLYNSKEFSLYGNVYGGVNFRSEDFSNEFRGGLELGAGFLDSKLWVVAKLDTTQSFNDGDRDFSNGGSVFFANNAEVTSLSPEVSYYFTKKIGISASTSIPLSGKFVYANASYSAGIFIDVK